MEIDRREDVDVSLMTENASVAVGAIVAEEPLLVVDSAAGMAFDPPFLVPFEGNVLIGGFSVPVKYEELYRKIGERYGHIATTQNITRRFALFKRVEEALSSIHDMCNVIGHTVFRDVVSTWKFHQDMCVDIEFNASWFCEGFSKIQKLQAEAVEGPSADLIHQQEAEIEKLSQELKLKQAALQSMKDATGSVDILGLASLASAAAVGILVGFGINLFSRAELMLERSWIHERTVYFHHIAEGIHLGNWNLWLFIAFESVSYLSLAQNFQEYIVEALSEKTVLLVTHQVDFLPVFDSVLLMSDGEIQQAAPYHMLLSSSQAFRNLVNAHKDTAASERHIKVASLDKGGTSSEETGKGYCGIQTRDSLEHQLIEQENYWMAANVQNPRVGKLRLIVVYTLIGCSSMFILLLRSLSTVALGMASSKSLFNQLLNSLFRAPVAFYESTPMGRILSRVSSDLSIVDLDLPASFVLAVLAILNVSSNLVVLAVITWQVLFVSIPMIYMVILLQSSLNQTEILLCFCKRTKRINGTTKSMIANHLGESIAGAMTIRAFQEEDCFFAENLDLIDKNASPSFHIFSANEWLSQRLEIFCVIILCSSALVLVLLPAKTFGSGFVGMALSYGLSLNLFLVFTVQTKCTLENHIISVERLHQFMHIPSEAAEIIDGNRPMPSWPAVGRVEIYDLEIRYRLNTPIVLQGISCTFVGGHKIGIVGRTGSGKSTLIGALFRLIEPVRGKIIIDGIDISRIGLHDLRSRLGIIPQDPRLFMGTVRYNLDPLSRHTDQEIWEVLDKCQLRETVQEKENGLDSSVHQDGVNWSMGQRQLFCLGRVMLRRSQILILDEATASVDNATDSILQKTIQTEFASCTVITVAHRIPTVMDSTMVLAISDGKIIEYDEPMKLMKEEGSLYAQLVKEYWSHIHSAESL
ncbi:ABC transporter C family member 10-like [Papaver somniferum]|uniref:ABC transporter C family member 10-like n=1 Tax=Papaver somniferum TaxID=3469 RepID=UPI000E705CAD|nr:ABC transporter C family member 10-like [Papaver somniferum]